MNRQALLVLLQEHTFNSRSISVSFGEMDSPVLLDTEWGSEVTACSRKLLPDLGISEQFIEEVQRDLDLISQKHPDITHYKIWLYQIPTIHKNIVRYAKGVKGEVRP